MMVRMVENAESRLWWLKKIRERHGLVQAREDMPLSLFGVESWEEFIVLINRAAMFVRAQTDRYDAAFDALFNAYALGWADHGMLYPYDQMPASVIERRKVYLKRRSGSIRTLERLEDEGAEMLLAGIGMTERPEFEQIVQGRIDRDNELLVWWRQRMKTRNSEESRDA